MFGKGIRLPFKLFGIPLLLDWSFLIILPILAWAIGREMDTFAAVLGVPHPETLTAGWQPYMLGLIAALGLFVSVVLHELGHAVAARLYGVKVRNITLWFLGGVARFEEMPRQRGAEAVVAVVGPIVSFALAILCWIILRFIPESASGTLFVFAYLTAANFVVALFNLIPALPLDGGRILRSVLALFMPHLRATRIAATVAKGFAILLGLVGIFSWNFWLLLIAIFIWFAVNAETGTSQIEDLLRGVLVRDLMNREVRTVNPSMHVAELMQHMLDEHHLGFPVVDADGRIIGMVGIQDVQKQDTSTPVENVMRRTVPTIHQDAEARELFRMMSQDQPGRIVATDDEGRMVGIITKSDLMRLIQLRSIVADLAAAGQGPTPDELRHYPALRNARFFPQH